MWVSAVCWHPFSFVSIDGTQKLYRNGLLQDIKWCERKVGNPEEENMRGR